MKIKEKERFGYIFATIACALLTLLSFYVVTSGMAHRLAIWTLFISALLQVIIQLRYFLHIDHSKQAREDLQLILFSAGLMLIMILGTMWILGNLMTRMG